MEKYDYLIVGSGLFGATFAYFARRRGKRCLIIDKRPHLGGNLYCEKVEGINVHKYGAHIFHTSNRKVWDFVNSLVPFNRFTNAPLANYNGQLFHLPFNMNTFYELWGTQTPLEAQIRIDKQRQEVIEKMKKDGVSEPRNLEEQALLLVGREIYETFVKKYTEKQWGRPCSDLPAFIIRRLPIRFTYDNNYFNDTFQGIPIGGYNKLIDALLDGIETKTDANFFENRSYWENVAEKTVYTGPLDAFFNYSRGKLDWRTVSFKTRVVDIPNYQGNAVVNYTSNKEPYTRIIEHKHFEMFGRHVYDVPKTVISEEYPAEYREGMEPYYPVNDSKNDKIANVYRRMAAEKENVIFGGRLAEYKYYDMAPVIENVMKLFE